MIDRECRDMRSSFLDLLCPSALWVNSPASLSVERSKARQLVIAEKCGLQTPQTLISNDPNEIRSFVDQAVGPVVYKTFNSFVPTTVLSADLLSEPELLRWTPGIYQHYIAKAYDLRVTVIGRRLFPVLIKSQQTSRGRVDWREAQWQPQGKASDLVFEPASLPRAVASACRRLMRTLGLVYGAIDFVVTPEGGHVFLEVNPSGQFLWVEHEVGLPLLDALSEMLIQGRLDYQWDRRSPGVRFDSDLLQAIEARRDQSMRDHVCDLQSW